MLCVSLGWMSLLALLLLTVLGLKLLQGHGLLLVHSLSRLCWGRLGLCGQPHVPAHVQPADVSDVLSAVCLWLLSVHKVHCSRKALGKPLPVGRLPLIWCS